MEGKRELLDHRGDVPGDMAGDSSRVLVLVVAVVKGAREASG
jgi:hypothetical protein